MDQRTEFALKSMKTTNFRELCREYGFSTTTAKPHAIRDRMFAFNRQFPLPW